MNDVNAEQIFRKLISFDTTSARSNLELADYVCEMLDPVASHVVRDLSDDGRKTNLMIRVGPQVEDPRLGIVLSGHMDTVPALEPGWNSNPFELVDSGDRWVARGASDMKGFLALAIDLARRTDPESLDGPIVLLFTYDEEVGTLGAKHWIDHHGSQPLPRSVIIGEPTELQVVRMHKGHLKLLVSVYGVSAHSGYPHLGVNAIERAGSVVEALRDLRVELESERSADSEWFESVPWVPLNLGEIHGGTAINIVPDRCDISIGLRLLPGLDAGDMIARVNECITAAIEDPRAFELSLINESPPMKLDESAPLARALYMLTGQNRTRAVSYATDAGWFQTLGLECVLFGPGSIEVAHKPNEYVPKDQFHRAAQLLETVTHRFCYREGR